MNARPFLVLVGLSAALVGGACDDEDGPPSDGGVDGRALDGGPADAGAGDGGASLPPGVQGTKFNALASAQQKQVCDWAAAQFGGYGKQRTCPDGSVVPALYQTQDECLVTLAPCDATIAALEACLVAMAREICSEDLPAECQSLPETCI